MLPKLPPQLSVPFPLTSMVSNSNRISCTRWPPPVIRSWGPPLLIPSISSRTLTFPWIHRSSQGWAQWNLKSGSRPLICHSAAVFSKQSLSAMINSSSDIRGRWSTKIPLKHWPTIIITWSMMTKSSHFYANLIHPGLPLSLKMSSTFSHTTCRDASKRCSHKSYQRSTALSH